jgi:predicted unusual protein kinase regulating ubiquinone biosynthesis (AarF/ABC1/UbiB family)
MKAAQELGTPVAQPAADARARACASARQATRPVPPGLRFIYAHWVMFLVVASYLSLKLQARFRSPAALERTTASKHRRNARRIEQAIVRLQGLFIKVGQLISIMTNFLPPEFRSGLERLQDQVPPHPFGDIEQRFREEFGGRSPAESFAQFEPEPVASASIGQVHRARMHDGAQVAVKVQYPNIERIVRMDLRTLRRIFRIIGYFAPYHGLDSVYRDIREMVLAELDFRREADNIERIAANFRGRNDIGFPRVVRPLSTGRVLTTEWIDGVKASDRERILELALDRRALARMIVHAYCQQIFSDGIYHADPHPGNLLVASGPRVVFLDFGAIAQVSPAMRRGIADFLQGAFTRDSRKIVDAMKRMGFIAKGADPGVFDRVVEYFHERFQEEVRLDSFSLKDIRFDPQRAFEDLADLRKLDVGLRDLTDSFHVPKDWILLERTILLLMGLCTELDPEMNPVSVIRPYLEEFVLGKDRDWSQFVVDTGKEMMLTALGLPAEVKRFMMRAQRGELEVRFRNLDENVRVIYTLGHQLIYTLCALMAGAFWLVLDGRANHAAARVALYVGGGFGMLLLGSIVSTRNRLKRRRRR